MNVISITHSHEQETRIIRTIMNIGHCNTRQLQYNITYLTWDMSRMLLRMSEDVGT